MDKISAAERVLSFVTRREYAHTIVGDLVESNELRVANMAILFLRIGFATVSDLSASTITGLAMLQLAQALAATASFEHRDDQMLDPYWSAWIVIYLLFCRLAFPFVVGRIVASSGRAREVGFTAACAAVVYVVALMSHTSGAASSIVMEIAPTLALFGGGACARSLKRV